MILDPEIKKIVWDARVKIVIGRFIITAVQFVFGFIIITLFLEYQIFGGGDTFIKPMVLYVGLPLFLIILLFGYQISYKPKKMKIDIFTKYLVDFKEASQKLGNPSEVTYAKSFSNDVDLHFHDNILYLCYKDQGDLCFLPYQPAIEELDAYQAMKINYTPIKIDLKSVKYSAAQQVLRASYSYDSKKKLLTSSTSYDTLTLQIGDKTILFESKIASLLGMGAAKPIAVQPQIVVPTSGDDIEKKIEKLAKMREQNLISDAEFAEQKKRLLDQL